MSDIDPQDFGELRANVATLTIQLSELRADVKKLTALAERSRGAMWLGMGVAALLGGGMSQIAVKVLPRLLT